MLDDVKCAGKDLDQNNSATGVTIACGEDILWEGFAGLSLQSPEESS